jgi:hypothetical protein
MGNKGSRKARAKKCTQETCKATEYCDGCPNQNAICKNCALNWKGKNKCNTCFIFFRNRDRNEEEKKAVKLIGGIRKLHATEKIDDEYVTLDTLPVMLNEE